MILSNCDMLENSILQQKSKPQPEQPKDGTVIKILAGHHLSDGELTLQAKSNQKYLLDKICDDFRKIIESIYSIDEDKTYY